MSIVRMKKLGKLHKYVVNDQGKYNCEYCDYTTAKQSTMSEHITRIHPVEAGRQLLAFHCEICDVRFQTSTQKQHHFISVHTAPTLCCPYQGCRQMTKNQTTMFAHYVNKHMNKNVCIVIDVAKNAKCKYCQKNMKTGAVPYHLAKCNPNSPFFQGSVMCDGGDDTIVFKVRRKVIEV